MRDKRYVYVSTMEYDIGPLGIESNMYIFYQGTKNLTKLIEEKALKINKLKKEVKCMKKTLRSLRISKLIKKS